MTPPDRTLPEQLDEQDNERRVAPTSRPTTPLDSGRLAAGMIVGRGESAWFFDVALAQSVVLLPPLTKLELAPRDLAGLTMIEGEVVPIVKLWANVTNLVLVCEWRGERVGFTGFERANPGRFPRAPHPGDGVIEAGQIVPAAPLDKLANFLFDSPAVARFLPRTR